MVTEKTLAQSYISRPRHSVVFWAVISFIFSSAALFLLISWEHMPNLYEFLGQYDIIVFGKTYALVDFLNKYGADKIAALVLLIIPYFFVVNTSEKRAFYLLFYIPLLFVVVLYVAMWIPLYLENIYTVLPKEATTFLHNVYPYICYANAGLNLVCAFVCLFYCNTYPIEYREIYKQRKYRIKIAKEYQKGLTPREIKKNFYRYYRKKKWDEMLDLLYGTALLKAPNVPLTDDEFEYFAICTSRFDAKIRHAELALLRKSDEWNVARSIYNRQLAISQSPDCGLRKAKEDKAVMNAVTLSSVPVARPVAKPAAKPTEAKTAIPAAK